MSTFFKLAQARFPLHVSHCSAHDSPFLGLFPFLPLEFRSNSFLFYFYRLFLALWPSLGQLCSLCAYRSIPLALFQVQEVRVFAKSLVTMIAYVIFVWFDGLYTTLSLWNVLLRCLDWILVCYASEQWVRTDNLAQTGLPRLGEMSRGSPMPFRARGGSALFERASVSLRRGESRLSENAQRPLFKNVEPSPRRRELAWARPFGLSEELGESVVMSVVFSVLWWFAMVELIYYIKSMRRMIMHEGYDVWVVNDNCGMILACDSIWDDW